MQFFEHKTHACPCTFASLNVLLEVEFIHGCVFCVFGHCKMPENLIFLAPLCLTLHLFGWGPCGSIMVCWSAANAQLNDSDTKCHQQTAQDAGAEPTHHGVIIGTISQVRAMEVRSSNRRRCDDSKKRCRTNANIQKMQVGGSSKNCCFCMQSASCWFCTLAFCQISALTLVDWSAAVGLPVPTPPM